MRNCPSRLRAVPFVFLLVSVLSVKEAHAYVDPGAGSLVFQLVVAAVFGALFTIKLWSGKTKAFLRGLFSRGHNRDKVED